ncbi:Holliday junction resolvase RuvX [Sphingorhabdus sp. Alg239-R122]|uniref:Holliday junction resolvase RuvX n=1 Tax=Sphingorhabdus sp. Alg239-R122 TaxID=2305989 RepID=UPI0013DA4002|nr:Holliday junction resolvase RuvX [Sphingorhabdus sp. Alg239-R122]
MITENTGEYYAALPDAGRLMGLDVGSKTIGTAFCDAGWSFATAAKTIKRRKFGQDRATIVQLIQEQAVTGLVIGLPLNLDGTNSPQTQSVRSFTQNMQGVGLPILLWDERWSTQAVERALVEQDVSRGKRAERIDSSAAAYILQGAIDALVNV